MAGEGGNVLISVNFPDLEATARSNSQTCKMFFLSSRDIDIDI